MTITTRPGPASPAAPAPLVAPGPGGEPRPGRAEPLPLRREGPAKLTGLARYTDDLVFPGAWYGTTIRSTEPHARFLGLLRDPAFDWSRVVVVTARDIPGENAVSSPDQPVLVPEGGEIQHQAEPLALVAAADRATLLAARRHLSARTEPLPPVFDPLLSTRSVAHYEIERGDAEAGFAAADAIIEGEYRVGHQEQLYIENQAMIAVPGAGNGVTVHGSLQCPYYVHEAMKRVFGLSDLEARVVQAETGGGFGGKEEYPSMLAVHAALLARKAGRPVRMIYDRHEDLAATTKRHPAIVRHRTGVSREGRLLAQRIEIVLDAGAYATLSPVVLSRAALHAGGPYACPNVHISARAMVTNTPPNGAFRGFGAPQAEFAAEVQVSRIAEALGVSPLELRRRWAYRVEDVTPTGQVLRESVGAQAVLEQAAAAADLEAKWRLTAAARQRRERRPTARLAGPAQGKARGVGLALAWHGAGFTGSGEVHLASRVAVELDEEGAIRILTASTEMGQGTRTVFPQLAAETLGIPCEAVEVAPQDTAFVPNSGPTVASRTTMIVGGLVIRACQRLRQTVEARAGAPFAAVYREDARRHGPLRVEQRFEPFPGEPFDDRTYRGDAYPAFGWAAAVAEVEVDLDTGEVAVTDVVSADDVGRAVHAVLAEGQVEGGTLQAVGYATLEEIKLEDGRYLNDRLATYLIPTALDAPRITALLVEEPFSGTPHQAKGLGELPMDVGAPAVVAAIHDAVGVWIHDLPASPERVLAALAGLTPPGRPGLAVPAAAGVPLAGPSRAGESPAGPEGAA